MSERRSRRSRGDKRTRAEIYALFATIALVVVLAAGAISAFMLVSELKDYAGQSRFLSDVLSRLESVSAKAADAENEQKAYSQNPDPGRLKGFSDAVAGIQADYQALLKLTADDPGTQLEIQAAKAQTDKAADAVRDAIDYHRTGQGAHALAFINQGGSLASSVRQAVAPLQKRVEKALLESRSKPEEIASRIGWWLLLSWTLAAIIGGTVSVMALRQAAIVGRLHRRLRRESIFDALTGLPNTVFLEEWLTRSIARASRTNARVGVLFVDINNFKQVNHGLGYSEGDKVLLELAEKLRTVSRASDFVARLRNDSFAVVMPDVVEAAQIETAMARLSGLAVVRSGIAIKITVGVAVFPEDAESADNLLRLSRAAMYRNRQGRRAA